MPKLIIVPVVEDRGRALPARCPELARQERAARDRGPDPAAPRATGSSGEAEDGRLRVEYEVDQNVNGDRWRIVLRHNGDKFADVMRTTKPPSGSFEVRRVVANRRGEDDFQARARAGTGEVCGGRLVFAA